MYKIHAEKSIGEIHQHYVYLHALLQIAENKLMTQLKEHLQHILSESNIIKEKLNTTQRELIGNIKTLNKFEKFTPKQINYTSIAEQARHSLKNTACFAFLQSNIENPFQ